MKISHLINKNNSVKLNNLIIRQLIREILILYGNYGIY